MPFNPPALQVSRCQHHGKNIIEVRFDYDKRKDIVNRFKQLPGARWSTTLKSWLVPNTVEYRKSFGLPDKAPVGKEAFFKVHLTNQLVLTSLDQELGLRNDAFSTHKVYLMEFAQLLYALRNYLASDFGYKRFRSYFTFCLTDQHISTNQLHSRINDIKFYFEQVLIKRAALFRQSPTT